MDSCFIGVPKAFYYFGTRLDNYTVVCDNESRNNNLAYTYLEESIPHISPPYFLHQGQSILDSPIDYDGKRLGLKFFKRYSPRPENVHGYLSDVSRYSYMLTSPWIVSQFKSPPPPIYDQNDTTWANFFGTGLFKMNPNDTAHFAVAYIFANGKEQLFAVNRLVQRIYDNGLRLPSPPPQPILTATALDRSVLLQWDSTAEQASDIIIPDSLGKPFLGYRLYRSRNGSGPFILIKEWKLGQDSIVRSYRDEGIDGADTNVTGLMNTITYYYKLTAFDEGAEKLSVPQMESEGDVVAIAPMGRPTRADALDEVRIVPNPYIVQHRGQPAIEKRRVYFTYLPEECVIRIYTVGLVKVAEIQHRGGATAEWDLRTQGGQEVASQMFIAHIETVKGNSVWKKFAVIVGD